METQRAKQITKEMTPILEELVKFINKQKPSDRIEIKTMVIKLMNQ